jgi:hypothetical protein
MRIKYAVASALFLTVRRGHSDCPDYYQGCFIGYDFFDA